MSVLKAIVGPNQSNLPKFIGTACNSKIIPRLRYKSCLQDTIWNARSSGLPCRNYPNTPQPLQLYLQYKGGECCTEELWCVKIIQSWRLWIAMGFWMDLGWILMPRRACMACILTLGPFFDTNWNSYSWDLWLCTVNATAPHVRGTYEEFINGMNNPNQVYWLIYSLCHLISQLWKHPVMQSFIAWRWLNYAHYANVNGHWDQIK